MISGVIFNSLILFELTFLYGVRERTCFVLLHLANQYSQCHLLKSLSFPYFIFLSPLLKIN